MTASWPLGDYLRAVHRLGIDTDPAARAAVMKLFGLTLRASAIAPKDASPTRSHPPDTVAPKRPEPPKTAPRSSAATPVPIPATLRQLAPPGDAALIPRWLSTADPLPPSSPRLIPTKPSLYDPRWVRAILTTALGTWENTNELDVTRLLEDVVNQRVIQGLPLRKALSHAHGVYCWIDNATGMQPFATDQLQIVLELYSAVGPARLNILPTKGVPPRTTNLIAGVPHLILSDLGARKVPGELRADSPQRWAEWADALSHDYDTTVIALVPAPVDQYPPELRQACILIGWDRRTSVQSVRRALVNARV